MNKLSESILFGFDNFEGLVAAEWKKGESADEVCLYVRKGDQTDLQMDVFRPWCLIKNIPSLEGVKQEYEMTPLAGKGALKHLVSFNTWTDYQQAQKTIKSNVGGASFAQSETHFINDPVQQYLMYTGRTLFQGMTFSDLKRMQVDIETYTDGDYGFCNANRKGDRITAIALADNTGWSTVLDGSQLGEKELLEQFVAAVQQRDPDVIEGHNIFNFDLPYLLTRAKKCGVELVLGRDGSIPKSRASRFSVAERALQYTRCDIHGRHVIDTYFLVQYYDISTRSLDSFGLKKVAIHFNVAAPNRTYVESSNIANLFDSDPEQLMQYAHDDILETRAVASILSPVYFAQAQMLPFSYQNVTLRGNAMKIDALMLREYLRHEKAIPIPQPTRTFSGGYTDMFVEGVAHDVHHVDVRSLYPSLMLERKLGPNSDQENVFLQLLTLLRDLRFEYKNRMQQATSEDEKINADAMQSCFKILINSFYGYLGFGQGHFNDFDAAEGVTSQGRDLLKQMIETINELGGQPIEVDTDGIYFVPPKDKKTTAFQEAFIKQLPKGIEVEFDGHYKAMFSYKMKNYALLDHEGHMSIKGAALKSRGLEPFQRDYLNQYLQLKLEDKESEIPRLQQTFSKAIRERKWSIEKLAKKETLQGSPSSYATKIERGERSKNAAYELALASDRAYRAGDQVTYYITGDKKSVTAYSAAKLVSEWDPNNRDENVPYYIAKLESLFKKFGNETIQQELF